MRRIVKIRRIFLFYGLARRKVRHRRRIVSAAPKPHIAKAAMTKKTSPIRPTTEDAKQMAQHLLNSAKYVSLAVLDPLTGGPYVSRVLIARMPDGGLITLVSQLAAHTKALMHDPRVSLLAGEPGKGDPLAYPRITVQCLAEPVARDGDAHKAMRQVFLDRHAKAKLYIDFADFQFFRLLPQSANLNGGFGQAFVLDGAELAIRS